MDDQAARVADIGEMAEQLDVADERDAGIVAALQPEGEHRAGALRAIALGERMEFVAGQPRIIHPGDLVVGRDSQVGDRERIVAMALHAQRQRLDAGQDEEGVERRDRRAEIAQAQHAAGDGEGEIAEGLGERDAVIGRPRGPTASDSARSPIQSNVPQSTMAPPIELPCPPRNLVSECTTMSAPCSIGRMR